jgi:phosphoglycerate dehydrogenase-like enzyme
MMKPTAILINTARGAIVNEGDLVEALQTGQIAGAGLDVFEKEPLPSNSPLLGLPNVILTPHSAATTPETTEAGVALAIDNIFRFIAGSPANLIS